MTLTKAGTPWLLGIVLTLTLPTPSLAQSCPQVVETLHARTTALNNEARANTLDFLRDDVVGTALGAAKRRLEAAGDPTMAGANQVQDAREKAEAWLDRLNSFDAYFTRLTACMRANCSVFKFIEEENARSRLAEAVQNRLNEWVKSLGDNGIAAAAERVEKASSIVKNAVGNAQGIAHEAVTGAASCMGQYVQTAQAAQADPVDPRNPSAAAPASRSGGGSAGKVLGLVVGGAAAVIGGAYAYQQAQLLAEETGSFTTNTTTSNPQPTSNTPSTVGLGGFSCTAANATSNFRTCTGAINVRAGTILAARAGSSIGVQTLPSIFTGTLAAPALGDTTGTVSLRATLASCPTQTSVVFFVPVSLQQLESVSVSIPVSCP